MTALTGQPVHASAAAAAAPGQSLVQVRGARWLRARILARRAALSLPVGASPNPCAAPCRAPRAAPQAMQEVPVVFFQRDFDFAHPDTFAAVCGDTSVPPALVRRPRPPSPASLA